MVTNSTPPAPVPAKHSQVCECLADWEPVWMPCVCGTASWQWLHCEGQRHRDFKKEFFFHILIIRIKSVIVLYTLLMVLFSVCSVCVVCAYMCMAYVIMCVRAHMWRPATCGGLFCPSELYSVQTGFLTESGAHCFGARLAAPEAPVILLHQFLMTQTHDLTFLQHSYPWSQSAL